MQLLGDSHRHLVFEFVKPLLTQRTVAIDGDQGNSYASGLGDDFTLSATVKAGLAVLKSTPPGAEQPLDADAVLDFLKVGAWLVVTPAHVCPRRRWVCSCGSHGWSPPPMCHQHGPMPTCATERWSYVRWPR